jgi:Ca2+-binding EF-hand superfamily protein
MGRKVLSFKRTTIPFTEEQLMNIFKSHDADGDGKLSQDEVKKAFKYLGSRWDAYRANQAIHLADADDDGYIEEEELKKLVQYALDCGYTIG